MTNYNYRESVTKAICAYITDNNIHWTGSDRDETEEKLRDDLWCEDSVTGNGSGSYTFSRYQAEENLCHNLDLLGEALNEFECGADFLMNKGAEASDVTIRCYLLGECIAAAMDALDEEGWNGEDEGMEETDEGFVRFCKENVESVREYAQMNIDSGNAYRIKGVRCETHIFSSDSPRVVNVPTR